jgi:hypothetical protein
MRSRGERWLPLLFVALGLAAVAPIFRYPQLFASPYDWRYFQTLIEVGRRSVVWFHQVPLWNPYSCGGEVLLANPQSQVASPMFALPLLFGTALGLKLVLAAYLALAFDGMYRLGRSYELGRAGALLASMLWGAGGWLALHLSSGHANFAAASLFPYLMLFYRRGLARWEWAIPLGAVAAWIVGDGGTSTPAMAVVLLATMAVTDALARRSLAPFRVLALGALAGGLLGAARILPALEFAVDHPRRQWETDASMIWEMIRNGYWWRGVAPVGGKPYWFHEYGWRLAYVTPPLILWSLRIKKMRALWIVVAVGAGIVAGRALPYGPWWLLKHLPIYRDLRVPSRYAVMFALAFPLLSGAALEDLLARLGSPRARRLAAVAVVTLAAVDGLAFDYYCFRNVFNFPLQVAEAGTSFHHEHGEWRLMMNHVISNHGAIGCDEEAPLQRAETLDEGDVPQVRLAEADADAGQVRAIRWTPNRIEADVALARPATVMFNMNWNEHWKASIGEGSEATRGASEAAVPPRMPVDNGEVVRVGKKHPRDRDGGRLGVAAPAGTYTLAVQYRPRSFTVGAAISLVAAPLLLALWLLRRRSLNKEVAPPV